MDKKSWNNFNMDMSKILEITLKGSVDKRLMTTTKIIISYAVECYGYEEGKKSLTDKESRRETKITIENRIKIFHKTIQKS